MSVVTTHLYPPLNIHKYNPDIITYVQYIYIHIGRFKERIWSL